MFEDPNHPILSRRQFATRMAVFAAAAVVVDGLVLALGAIGYRFLEGLNWLDATVNSALVMTGNGPAHQPHTTGGKLFTIVDSLLGVMLFAAVIGVLLTPIFHRMLHSFHNRRQVDLPIAGETIADDDRTAKQPLELTPLQVVESESWKEDGDLLPRHPK